MSSRRVEIVIDALDRVSALVCKKITLDVVANLMEPPPVGTPRDTGWAANNWIPAVGSPYDEHVESKGDNATAIAARVQGEARVATYDLDDGPLWASNGVPYIGRLDAGHSKKQPAGFVARAVVKAVTEDIKSLPSEFR